MNKSDKLLTVIIPFLNEGEEIKNTVSSIRQYVGMQVDIIVINDGSNKMYNYSQMLTDYSVVYVQNENRLGVAESLSKGVGLMNTPYFLFLDAHMRFYDDKWIRLITDRLLDNDRKILCCKTLALEKINNEVCRSNIRDTYGAYIILEKQESILQVRWFHQERSPLQNIESIPCVLGAAYAGSKRYWDYLKGLDGLIYYGSCEPYLSLKVWLEGGVCELLKDAVVGHIYRQRFPYRVSIMEVIYNRMLIATLLLPDELKEYVFSVSRIQGGEIAYQKAIELLDKQRDKLNNLRDYYGSIIQRPIDEILKMNRMEYISDCNQETC